MQTYLFYDIETTGLNKAFDQVLQFAAIRTDLNLKELKRYELRVKLNVDTIPAPKAVITHHIGIKEALNGIPEIDAIKQIHTWLNEPGTISLGYNTLGFDDEFLRFSFYRNLLPPYTHQYANQCGRMDIYPMTVMFFLFHNHVLTWPQRNNKLSLKLEDLNSSNQLVAGRAHHAMVDVEATLALAQRFFAEKSLWHQLEKYFNKETDPAKLLKNPKQTESLMIHGKIGHEKNYQCPVLSLGNHHHYKNQSLWLKLDSETISQTTSDNIDETTKVVHKKWGEPSFILPMDDSFTQHLSTERRKLAETNKKWLHTHPDIFNEIINYHAEYLYPVYPETDIEASLYLNGFWSFEDEKFCRRFHQVAPEEKASLTEQLQNPKLKMLAVRLLGRHYPDALTASLKEQFENYLEKTRSQDLIDYRGAKRLCRKTALEDIAALRKEELSAEQELLLRELEEYFLHRNPVYVDEK